MSLENIGIVMVVGPSGVGKNTIIDRVIAAIPGLVHGKSMTTRARRSNDVPGKYRYVDRTEFMQAAESGELLEWAEYSDNLYGTLAENLNEPAVLLELDLQGAVQIKARHPEVRMVFILPPGQTTDERLSVLRQRLVDRKTDTPEVIEKRLKVALIELEQGVMLADCLVVNDDLNEAVAQTIDYVKNNRRP